MTYHIKLEEYFCPKCNARYIPYKVDLPCPNCKVLPATVPDVYLDFIGELVGSLRVNMTREGSYLPAGFYIGSFAEQIQYIVFNIFEHWRKKKPKGDDFIVQYLNEILSKEEIPYMVVHLKSILKEVYLRRDELKVGFWMRLLPKLMP